MSRAEITPPSNASQRTPLRRRIFRFARARKEPPARQQKPLIGIYRRRATPLLVKVLAYSALGLFCLLYGGLFARYAPHLMVGFIAPLAAILVLGIWALPSGDYAPTGAIPWLFMGFFASRLLWPNYLALTLPGLPWITVIRIFGAPMAVVLLICTSVSRQFRDDVRAVLSTDWLLWRALVAFVATQILSIAFSSSPGSSTSRFIADSMNWVSVFFCGCYVFRQPGMADRWARLLIAMGFLLSLIGGLEFYQRRVVWGNHIPSFLTIDDEHLLGAILAGAARASNGIHRVMATSSTPLGFAEYLGMTMPFAMHFAVGRYSLFTRLFCAAYIPLAFATILTTDSRLGVVATLVSALAFLLLWSVRHWRYRRDSIIGPAIVLAYPAIFSIGVASTFVVGKLRNMVWGGGATAASTDGRKVQWAMGIPKIVSHPLGHGLGMGGSALGYVQPDGTITIDSYYLTLLMEYGFFGFAIYMAMFIWGAWIMGKTSMKAPEDLEILLLMPLSVAILSMLIVKAVFSQEDNDPLLFMMLAAGLALIRRAKLAEPAASRAIFGSHHPTAKAHA
jgi:hypothetical protein